MTATLGFIALGLLLGGLGTAVYYTRRQAQFAVEAARLLAELQAARQAVDEHRARAEATQAQLRETFSALSRDALKENRSDFLHNATVLMQPVRETLDKVQAQLAEVDKAREGSHQAVSSQLRALADAQSGLRSAAETLSRSLRSPNVRGQWGEVQLRRVVELAGMLEQCDFVEKESTTSDEAGRQTPDLVVKLPGNTNIVVDAKVPIDAYLAATNATTDAERADRLAAHARQVRDHIRALGGKEYWRQFDPSPEFVVMFLPLEPLMAAAFEQDGTLLDQAASLRVVLATPMTLLALLKAVSYGWRQQQLAKNAEEIQQIGRELYDRLSTMTEHLGDVGDNLKRAAASYDRFIGSLERKVLPGVRRFKELGVSSTKELEVPDPLNLAVRRVRHEDLTPASGEPDDDLT